MAAPVPVLCDGPGHARTKVVLAHGAGAGMEHSFLATVAQGLAAAGFAVVRFEFPYQHEARTGPRRAPDRLPVLQATMREVVLHHARAPIVLAGKSMGGRVATTIADELGVAGVVVFGYPFHPPKRPAQLRTAHLEHLQTRTLILQGERDPFGTRADVAGYKMSPQIEVVWFADGDHSLAPRQRSGFLPALHLQTAIERTVAFVREMTGDAR